MRSIFYFCFNIPSFMLIKGQLVNVATGLRTPDVHATSKSLLENESLNCSGHGDAE